MHGENPSSKRGHSADVAMSKSGGLLGSAHPSNPYRIHQVSPTDVAHNSIVREEAENRHAKKPRRLFQDSSIHSLSSPVQTVSCVPVEPAARRCLDMTATTQSSQLSCTPSYAATQEIQYSAHSQVGEEDACEAFLQDVFALDMIRLKNRTSLTIGRAPDNDVVVDHDTVARRHCVLTISHHRYCLYPLSKPCWVSLDPGKWQKVNKGDKLVLEIGTPFRLLPASNKPEHHQVQRVQFLLIKRAADSFTADYQYVQLLRAIEWDGRDQSNKKGRNRTLPQSFTMEIDLASEDGTKDLLPIITLRKIFHQSSKIEAIWYLRGEDTIHFLRENKCRFWDAQADCDGFLGGLSYGLLTNFPCADGTSYNQLEEKVIKPLAKGKSSRNMNCSLTHPGEKAGQAACTSGIQFSVADNRLDLIVIQRSSDVILGLPHDLIVWAMISHLVRREVNRRGRKLLPGKLYFNISPGGAHVYKMNEHNFKELLKRNPKPGVQPYMEVDGDEEALFEMVKNYKADGKTKIRVGGYNDYHALMIIDQAKDP